MVTAQRTQTRSRYSLLVGIRDLDGRVVSHAPAILTEDQWGDWKGVLHQGIPAGPGQEMVVWTPEGESLCQIEDKSNGQTLLIGVDPAPF